LVTQPIHDAKLGLLLLGRYRIVRKLGEGGMGAVYEGLHEMLSKRLAIKCLHAQFASNPEIVERFYREAHAATAVGNEHIIEVTDVGTFDDGSPFIVMEFLDGVEFGKLIEQEGSLPITRLVHIVTQVCSALAAAHARGIVHRDMKPENIFLIPRGRDRDFVKVLDFGISKMREQNESIGGGLTRTGMALGTPYYMAPEQAQGVRDIDHRADIYSVGIILYQGLTGNLPFDAESYPALLLKIMSERPAPMRVFRNDIPDALEQVVMQAMARDRSVRFQTIEALSAALSRFAVLQTLPPSSLGSSTPMPAPMRSTAASMPQTTPFATAHDHALTGGTPTPPRARDMRAMISIAAAVVVLGGVAAVWLASSRESSSGQSVEHVVSPAPVQTAQPVAPPAEPVAPAQPTFAQAPVMGAVTAPAAAEVQVKVSATPSEARIFIGDLEFPNPMDAFRPRSLDPVKIRVEAKGYQTVEQLAIFDQNRQLSVSLAQGRGVRRLDTAGTAQPTAKPQAAQEQPAAPAPAPTPVEAKAPAEADGIYRGPTGKLRQDF